MHVELSDLLTCPRCGPTHGLVLLPQEVADRRVRSGVLGCSNCRERYPVEAGVADLRVGAGTGLGPGASSEADGGAGDESEYVGEGGDPVVRLAGLMGLGEARGTVLVAGPASAHAAALSHLVEGVEVVSVGAVPAGTSGAGWTPDAGEEPDDASAGGSVSRLLVTTALPFRSGSLRGVALTGRRASLLEEGARVLGREGRLMVDPAPADARERLDAVGLTVVAEEGDVVVAVAAA